MQFDKGVTIAEAPSTQIKTGPMGTDIIFMIAGAILIGYAISART
jgi:hypothetical protein